MKQFQTSLALAVTVLLLPACGRKEAPPPKGIPKLTLLLVVDQLGEEPLGRFDQAFEGGFRRLLDEGVSFTEAHHAHARTLTAPGHATVVTGCHPSRHGIVTNYWRDRATGEQIYAVEDDRHGRSPLRLRCSSLGGWLKNKYSESRVFSLSIKDRSAILMGGRRADGAYWYDWDGTFTSSSYYRERNPAWLQEVNAEGFLESKFGQVWEPLGFEPEALAAMGVRQFDLGPLEEDFPHAIGGASLAPGKFFFNDIYESPWMNEYLFRLARGVITAEDLGGGAYPDVLAIGFSNVDAVGHQHGPDSREFFDLLVRLDRQLGDFFEWLDETVGMENVAIVLTSDHGSVPVPEERIAQGLPARRMGFEEIGCFQSVDGALDEEFGDADWFLPGPFFAPRPLDSEGAGALVRQRAKALIEACPSVSRAWLAEELVEESEDEMQRKFARSYFPGRSPDVLVQWDEYFLASMSSASSHGTSYRYDTHVPLIFWRAGMTPAKRPQPVRTVDIAPTLAGWLEVAPPEGIDGRRLVIDPVIEQPPDGARE